MVWLGLTFDTVVMTITIPQEKLAEVDTLVHQCQKLASTTLHPLCSMLRKLFFVAQCCQLLPKPYAGDSQSMPSNRAISLLPGFKKDLNWFMAYLSSNNGVHITHHNNRTPISLYVNTCVTGAGAICGSEAYHTPFPPQLVAEDHTIRHLEVVNAMVAIRT